MEDKEKTFFRLCYKLTVLGLWTVKEVISLIEDSFPHDECIRYLQKWSQKGMYDIGDSVDTGWLNTDTRFYPEEFGSLIIDL